jgi:hypothetical protein
MEMENSLKRLRAVPVAMLASILFNAFLAERFGPAPKEMTPVFFLRGRGSARFYDWGDFRCTPNQ